MKFKTLVSALVVAVSLAASAGAAFAGTTVKVVRANLTSASGGVVEGSFRLADVEREGVASQRLIVAVRGLDASAATDPAFEVILDDGTTEADLGALRTSASGKFGWLRFDTRTGTLPAGMTDLGAFSGGTLRIQLDGVDVATAAIPAFVEPDSGSASDETSIALGFGSVVLGDTSSMGAGPVARIDVWAANTPSGFTQGIAVTGFALSRGATYTVVLTGETEDTLGTIRAGNFLGIGALLVSTRRGDAIPGGSVGALAGRGVEIRDAGGAAVLTGTVPSLK